MLRLTLQLMLPIKLNVFVNNIKYCKYTKPINPETVIIYHFNWIDCVKINVN
jgi:hypothetical protein